MITTEAEAAIQIHVDRAVDLFRCKTDYDATQVRLVKSDIFEKKIDLCIE